MVLLELSSGTLPLLELGLEIHLVRNTCLVDAIHDRVITLVHVQALDLALFVEHNCADIKRAARLHVSIAGATWRVL